MHTFRSLLLLCGLSAALAPATHAGAPFRLFEVGVSRFVRDDSGQGRVQMGRLSATGTLALDVDSPTNLQIVPETALGKVLVFTEAWFAYGQLGAEARANFQLANDGAPVVIGNLLYYEVAPHPQAERAVGQVVNLSTRGYVAAGATPTLIGGFIIEGHPRRVLIRAVGPSLVPLGVPDALPDPMLSIMQGTTTLHANGDWGTQPEVETVATTASQLGAFNLPRSSKDAVLLLELAPGEYTAGVASESATEGGIALLEIYILP